MLSSPRKTGDCWREVSTTPSVWRQPVQRLLNLFCVFSAFVALIAFQFACESSCVSLKGGAFVCAPQPSRSPSVCGKSAAAKTAFPKSLKSRSSFCGVSSFGKDGEEIDFGCTDSASDIPRGAGALERRLAAALRGQDLCVLFPTEEAGSQSAEGRSLSKVSLWRETRVAASSDCAASLLRRHGCLTTASRRSLVHLQPSPQRGKEEVACDSPSESLRLGPSFWGTPLVWSGGLLPPSFPEKHKLPLQKTALILSALRDLPCDPPLSECPFDEARQAPPPFLPFGEGFALCSPAFDCAALEEAARLAHSSDFVSLALRGQPPGDVENSSVKLARLEKELGVTLSDHWRVKTLAEVGCSILSAQVACEAGLSLCASGGLHHAGVSAGRGYCLLNDVAIAAKVAIAQRRARRVLILDLDVHQGDGTAEIFRDDPRVFTLSVHCEDNYPKVKAKSDLDVSLPSGTEDAAYLKAVDEALSATLREFRPELVFYNAGVDPHAEDRIGLLRLSSQGLRSREETVFARVLQHNAQEGGRAALSCVVGGGYGWTAGEVVKRHLLLFDTARKFWHFRGLREVYMQTAKTGASVA